MNKQKKTTMPIRKRIATNHNPVGLKIRKRISTNHNENLLKIK